MQLFQVKAPDGALIMNAPMETIARVWYLTPATIAQILRTTARLDAEHVLSTARARWPATLHIQRLPLEIPIIDRPKPQGHIGDHAYGCQNAACKGECKRNPGVPTARELKSDRLAGEAAAAWEEQMVPALLRPQAGGPTRRHAASKEPETDCLDKSCPYYGIPHVHTTETTLGRLLCDE